MSQLTHDLQQKEAFVLKGSLQTMTIMHLQSTDIGEIESNLNYLISQTPKFFHQLPILLDLEGVGHAAADPIDFAQLVHTLKSRDLYLIGVRNGTPAQMTAASAEGLGTLPARKPAPAPTDQALTTGKGIKASTATTPSKIVTQPIRSGQQVHAKDGDLIILNTVSEGAEVLADGNIHIYGALRGRALAGLSGNTNARIFCQKLQAELVSIAGHYKLNEQIDLPQNPQGYQVFLKDESVQFAKL